MKVSDKTSAAKSKPETTLTIGERLWENRNDRESGGQVRERKTNIQTVDKNQ